MRRCTFLGGHRDGEIIDYVGPRVRTIARPPVAYYATYHPPPLPGVLEGVVDYRARQDDDGRWWYVLD